MLAYIDSSVIIRLVLGQSDRFAGLSEVTLGITSGITRVECLRTIDRLRIGQQLKDQDVAERNKELFRVLEYFQIIPLSVPVLERAAQPFPTLIGTLDAIHLSSAVLWKQSEGKKLCLLTHDTELARAAEAMDCKVYGV